MNAAVDLEDNQGGAGVDLEEKPQNLVELEVGVEGLVESAGRVCPRLEAQALRSCFV